MLRGTRPVLPNLPKNYISQNATQLKRCKVAFCFVQSLLGDVVLYKITLDVLSFFGNHICRQNRNCPRKVTVCSPRFKVIFPCYTVFERHRFLLTQLPPSCFQNKTNPNYVELRESYDSEGLDHDSAGSLHVAVVTAVLAIQVIPFSF